MHRRMANEQQTSTPDSVYSLAENVRRVAGTEEKRTETAVKEKARPKASKSRPKQVSVKSTPARKEIKKRKESIKETKETIVVSKETKNEPHDEQHAEEEYIDIKPGWFWKISTFVLAILVIWAYFFR